MHESMPPPAQDPEELRASLIAEHGDQQMMLNGQAIAFKDYVAVGDMLCPIPPEQRTPEDNLRRLTKELVKLDVQLDEKYAAFVPQQPKKESSDVKAEPAKEKADKAADIETAVEKPVSATKSIEDIVEKPETVKAEVQTSQPDRLATLLKHAVKEVVELREIAAPRVEPAAEQQTIQSIELAQIPNVDPVQQTVDLKPEVQPHSVTESVETVIKSTAVAAEERPLILKVENESIDLIHEDIQGSPVIVESETIVPFPEVIQVSALHEPYETNEVSFNSVAEAQSTEEPFGLLNEETLYTAETTSNEGVESSPEMIAASPQTVVQEFIAQVLPEAASTIQEQLQNIEPEVAAEVASRIEMVVIVADRLHELVKAGSTDGEEAKQIEAFLRREYEQILITVGIEPTEEMITNFIAYIFAESYRLKIPSVNNYIEISDDGTHEKKIFDEQSVFAKAQQASAALSLKLGGRIGRLLVTNLAA